MENNIEDEVVIITGASSGIGEATAVMLAERGAKVVLGARGLNRLEALARRIEATGGEVPYAQTDVRRREDLTTASVLFRGVSVWRIRAVSRAGGAPKRRPYSRLNCEALS
jgi:NADP-dependent 3-hydroxy acid dehydrogenase YdfG